MIPARSAGESPARARRDSVSWTVNPQSSMRRVRPASATSAFPWLPLPSEAKRNIRLLFELLLEQGKNPAGRVRRVGHPFLVEDLHLARVAAVFYEDPVLLRLGIGGRAPEGELREKAVVLLVVGLRIDVAHEVEALRAVAVLDGESDAIENEPDAPPGAVERLGELESAGALVGGNDGRLGHRVVRGGDQGFRTRAIDAEPDHQPAQELGLEARVRRADLPHRGVAVLVRVDLGHAAVADVYLGGVGLCATLEARSELVALGRRERPVDDLADQVPDRVLRDLCAVLRPVGLHHPGLGHLGLDHETVALPEILDDGPDLLRRLWNDQPALARGALDPYLVDLRENPARTRARSIRALRVVRRERGPGRLDVGDLVPVVARGRAQVRGNLQRRELSLEFLVFDLVRLEKTRSARAERQRQRGRECGRAVSPHPAFPSTTRRPLEGLMSAWRMASLTTSWNCGERGVRGRRMPMPMSPIWATAHFTGMGFASTKSLV